MSRGFVAALLSGLACPGAGQIYNRQYVKGGILAAITLIIVGAVFYLTWTGMSEATSSMPPEEVLLDLFGIARRVLESNRETFLRLTAAFAVVWVYGMVDAYVCGGRVKDLDTPGTRGSL
ncbi:MAG: hypothetical protein HZA22_01955 [Nitrospirae bacterium]|nr:hypothetical protein [Nitrospirota bacterium]